MDYLVQNVAREEIAQLAEIEAQSFASAAWSPATLLQSIDNPRHDVVGLYMIEGIPEGVPEHARELVGFAVFAHLFEEAELLRIAVSSQYRNKGIGRSLLQQQLAKMPVKGIEKVFLEVRESNLAAQHLYRHCGFRLDGRRKNYYPALTSEHTKEDALLFSAEL